MYKRLVVFLSCVALIAAAILPGAASAQPDQSKTALGQASSASTGTVGDLPDYSAYRMDKEAPSDDMTVIIDATKYSCPENTEAAVEEFDGVEGVATPDEGAVTWTFDVEETGLYAVTVSYYPVEGKGATIERILYLDGEIPYKEAKSIQFTRCWVNKESEKIYTTSGNEYRRTQIEERKWMQTPLYSSIGYSDDSVGLYLTAGRHSITFEAVAEPMAISEIRLHKEKRLPTYEERQAEYKAKGYRKASRPLTIEGEDAVRKSDSTLYAVEDRTSPANSPFSETKINLNTIGSNSWKFQGQWIEWEVDVPESGLYALSLRTKQDFVSGANASRRLYIDGEIPFEEASSFSVSYQLKWQMVTFGGDTPYEIYLEKGKRTIRLEVVVGELDQVLAQVSDIAQKLNSMYRRIKMITGNFPDPFRDYNLEENIPEIFTVFEECIQGLEYANEELTRISQDKGEQSANIDKLIVQLKSFLKDPDIIPEQVANPNSSFSLSNNISNLSAWLVSASEVPLSIDYLILAPAGSSLPPADAGFFTKLFSSVKNFVFSFFNDYYLIESVAGQTEVHDQISLWLGIGRDQSMILKNLADSTFTNHSGIGVNIRLVDMSILLQAVSSGCGPDVALFQSQAQPLNYGVRGALYDLNTFDDADEICARFSESAVTPFRLENHLYGLPEQQSFAMMFYRTDILEELGLSAPETWTDFYKLIPVLQEKNMEIGLPTPAAITSGSDATTLNMTFTSLLLQNGGAVYDEDNRYCTLNDLSAVNSFIQWSEFYTKYNFPKSFSEVNRFRTGEMPLLITNYTFYNSLALAAPEIRGLWAMAPIPGIRDDSGEVHREAASNVSSCVIFQNAQNPQACWEFLKWWTSAEAQASYGREIEALQGASARWPTANLEAMQELGWTTAASKAIQEQWQHVVGIPEVPGGYYVGRSVDNAIKSVINSGENARETLLDQVDKINKEIKNKREEFGLE